MRCSNTASTNGAGDVLTTFRSPSRSRLYIFSNTKPKARERGERAGFRLRRSIRFACHPSSKSDGARRAVPGLAFVGALVPREPAGDCRRCLIVRRRWSVHRSFRVCVHSFNASQEGACRSPRRTDRRRLYSRAQRPSARRSRKACASVPLSTYSSSPPTGTPRARRLTLMPRAASNSPR